MSTEWKNKEVLVTGGAGFIGSNLTHRLVQEGARVTVVDAMLPMLGGNTFNLSSISDEIHFERLDLRDFNVANRFASEVEFIFNLAGNVSHVDSMENPLNDLELNLLAQVNLLEACRQRNPKVVIVFTSTRQVYGVPQYLPVDEFHPIQPVDVNGINKWAAENYHLLYSKAYGMKTVCLRLTNTYGPRQLISHSHQGFIGWFVNCALQGAPIRLFGGGSQRRDFTYVDDVVDAILLAAMTESCIGNVYNLSGETRSLLHFAETLIELSEKRSELEIVPFPVEKKRIDIGDYVGVSDKFRFASGWLPKTGVDRGLERMVEYFRVNLSHYSPNL